MPATAGAGLPDRDGSYYGKIKRRWTIYDKDKHKPPKRKYPSFHEKAVNIALGIIVVAIVFLLIIIGGEAVTEREALGFLTLSSQMWF